MIQAASAEAPMIDIRNVDKTFRGKIHALRGVSMRIEPGEVFGLLGPNGAGKSTLVKILLTIVKPTRCTGELLGQRIGSKPALREVGFLPEHSQYPSYLTGAQALDYFGALAEVPLRDRKQRAAILLDRVGLTGWDDKRISGYSKGMRQRLGIAQALINNPKLIFLDEPTDGLDPVGRRDVRELLAELRSEGKTVFINSHLLSELESVCDRVAILVQGKVVQQGTLAALTAGQERYEVTIQPNLEQDTDAKIQESLQSLRTQHPTMPDIEVHQTTISVNITEPAPVQPLLDALRSKGLVIRSVQPIRPSLEDLFMRAVTDPTTGQAYKPGATVGKKANKGDKA